MNLLPPIPTDNLYKFMSITGLLVWLMTIIFPVRMTHEYAVKSIAYITALKKLNIEFEDMTQEMKKLAQTAENQSKELDNTIVLLKQAEKDKSAGHPYSIPEDSYSLFEQEFKSNKTRLHKLQIDLNLKNMDLQEKEGELDLIKTDMQYIKIISFVGIFIGCFLAFFGFYMWYHRVQKHLDKILLNQARISVENSNSITPLSDSPIGHA